MATIRKIALEDHFLTPEFGVLGAYGAPCSVDHSCESAASFVDGVPLGERRVDICFRNAEKLPGLENR